MLPVSTGGRKAASSAATYNRPGSSLTIYLRRLLRPQQLDLEYRHTAYHKQTKNQWARDDPAFVVVTCVLVALASIAYCVTFGDSLWHSFMTVISAVLVDFLLLGFAVASAGWLYAFDVHCNSYFPLFLSLYVVQFLLSPLLLWKSFVSTAVSVALYAVTLSYYHYMTFLGYSALPFLEHTEVFLWPVGAIFLATPFAILAGFNPTRFTLSIYFG
eukprot:gene23166-30376_t